jgi:cell pole-organizing protein PopZ
LRADSGCANLEAEIAGRIIWLARRAPLSGMGGMEVSMTVAASMNDSQEAEALRRAQRAHEPSMEEILASIRAIIADDDEPAAPKPQIVYSSDAPRSAPPAAEPPAPTVVWSRDVEAKAADPAPAPEEDAPLMSEEAEDEIAASFRSLSDSMAAHGREVAERIAREMLRPMLKEWLDQNLPAMVERLVRAEIQRVTRGRR